MVILKTPGLLIVKFEPQDWEFKNAKLPGGSYAVIDEIKNTIKHKSVDPEGWEYDDELKEWRMADTANNRAILKHLKKNYLFDENALSLFPEED